MKQWFSDHNIAAFTLIFMSVQILYIEGWAVSIPKVLFMAITPLILFLKSPYISKATIFGLLFWIVTVGMSILQFGTPRMSTFYYTLLFLATFCMYYNLIYINKAFSTNEFLNIIKIVIYAYTICLLLQQFCFIIGLKYFPLINLMGLRYYELFRLNTLAIEPSHAARILTVYFYAFLKTNEYKYGRPLSIKELYSQYKWIVIAFLYTMIAIGSGTAFVGLAILSLYFIKRQYALYIVIIATIVYFVAPFIEYTPLERAINIFNATITSDSELVAETDRSASTRVNIILDTFKYLDITDSNTWLGKGVDASFTEKHAIASGIIDYGLISYLLKLLFFFTCCFSGFFSLEVLIFILLFSLNIGNLAYGWAILMVFSTIKYFKYTEKSIS